MSSSEQDNLDHPLVHWVKAVYSYGRKIEYNDLFDAVLLNDLMNIVDPCPDENIVCKDPSDFNTRLFNWDLLLKSIQAYYKDVLQVYLCVGSPDIYLISREPCSEMSFKEVCKALLLILGCAVQGEQKEDFILNIKQLDVTIQHAIVAYIQEITDESLSILPHERSCTDDEYTDKITNHMERLLQERNTLLHQHMVMTHEHKSQQVHDQSGEAVPVIDKAVNPENESGDKKVKVRVLQTQLDEKDEQISDLRDEIEEVRRAFLTLKSENLDLVQKVHSLRSSQDDLDAFKEKASKADSLEEEVAVLKKKLNEVEFYKARIQELQDDNSVLEETKSFLEDQVGNTHMRQEAVTKLENELKKNKLLLDEYCQKINRDAEKISSITQENVELQREMSLLSEKKIIHEANLSIDGFDNPISAELQESGNVSKLQLELEIQRLNQQLEASEEELETLRNCVAQFEEDGSLKTHLVDSLKKVELENITLNDKLKYADNNHVVLEQQFNMVEMEKEKLKAEVLEISNNQGEIINVLEVENRDLKQQINDVEDEVEQQASDCKKLHQENRCLQSQLQEVACSEKETNSEVMRKDDEIQILQQRLSTTEEQFRERLTVTTENQDLQEKLKCHEKEKNLLMTTVKAVKSESQRLQEEVICKEKEFQAHVQEQNVKICAQENECKNLLQENHHLQSQLQAVTNSEKKISAEMKVKYEECELLQQEINKSHQQVMVTEEERCQIKTKLHTENQQLQHQLTNSERDMNSLKIKAEETEILRAEVQRLHQEIKEAENKSIVLMEKVEESHQLLSENHWLEQQVLDMEEELEKVKLKADMVEGLESDNKSLQQELQVIQEEHDILLDKSNESSERLLNESVRQLETENKELNDQLQMASAELQTLKIESSKFAEGERMVNDNLNQAEFENEKLLEQLSMTEDELDLIKEKYNESESLKRSLYEENRSLNESQGESLNQLESENHTLTLKLLAAEKEMENLAQKDKECEILHLSNVELKRKLNKDTAGSLSSSNQLQSDNRIINDQFLSLQQKINEYEEELTDVVQENQTLNQNLRHIEERYELLQQEYEKASRFLEDKDLNVNNSQIESLRTLHSENQDLIDQLHSADEEIQVLKDEKDNSEIFHTTQNRKVKELEEANQELQKQVHDAEYEMKSLQVQLAEFGTEIKIHKEENIENLSQLQIDNENYVSQLQFAEKQFEKLMRELGEAEQYKCLFEDKSEILNQVEVRNDELTEHLHKAEREIQALNQKMTEYEMEKKNHQQPLNFNEAQKASSRANNKNIEISQSYVKKQNTIIARLHVQNTAVKCQFASLIHQNLTSQNHIALLESEHENLLTNHEDLQMAHEKVLMDYEKLQKIHELLTLDYGDLVSEYILVRTNLINKCRESGKSDTNTERDTDGMSSSSSNELRGYCFKHNRPEHGEYQEDTCDSLDDPFEDFSAIDQDMQQMETNFNILHQINATLEEENQALLLQLQQILSQNQDLLTSAIDNKDYFNEEEKSYIEKLAELRRKKERLEEKLMEHYAKRKDTPKKSRGFSAIIKRVRAIILKSQKNKNKSSLESQNSVSQLNINNSSSSRRDSDIHPRYHSNFETGQDPEKLTLVEFLTEGMDKAN